MVTVVRHSGELVADVLDTELYGANRYMYIDDVAFLLPDFITSLVGRSVIIDYQLVISLFQQLMVTQLRIMESPP